MTINHSELLSVVPGGVDTQHHVDGANHTYLTSTEESKRVGTTLNGTLSEHATAIDGLKDGTLIEDSAIKANHIEDASITLAKINPAGASEGQVLGFSGGAIGWKETGGGEKDVLRLLITSSRTFIINQTMKVRFSVLGGGAGATNYDAGQLDLYGAGGGAATATFMLYSGDEIEITVGGGGASYHKYNGALPSGGDTIVKRNGTNLLIGYGGRGGVGTESYNWWDSFVATGPSGGYVNTASTVSGTARSISHGGLGALNVHGSWYYLGPKPEGDLFHTYSDSDLAVQYGGGHMGLYHTYTGISNFGFAYPDGVLSLFRSMGLISLTTYGRGAIGVHIASAQGLVALDILEGL